MSSLGSPRPASPANDPITTTAPAAPVNGDPAPPQPPRADPDAWIEQHIDKAVRDWQAENEQGGSANRADAPTTPATQATAPVAATQPTTSAATVATLTPELVDAMQAARAKGIPAAAIAALVKHAPGELLELARATPASPAPGKPPDQATQPATPPTQAAQAPASDPANQIDESELRATLDDVLGREAAETYLSGVSEAHRAKDARILSLSAENARLREEAEFGRVAPAVMREFARHAGDLDTVAARAAEIRKADPSRTMEAAVRAAAESLFGRPRRPGPPPAVVRTSSEARDSRPSGNWQDEAIDRLLDKVPVPA